jgi:hypothetical protein
MNRFSVAILGYLGIVLALPLPAETPVAWTPLFHGIDMRSWTKDKPRQIAGITVRIDLAADGIRAHTTPANGPAEGETDALKTTSFLRKHKLQLAINAAPFAPMPSKEGQAQDIVGLSIHEKEIVSPGQSGAPALYIHENDAMIAKDSARRIEANFAVGGFSTVLWEGEVVPHPNDKLHPRTAAGVSRDRRFLYLLIVDGRQPGYSEGATCEELGQWLKEAGCWTGLNLDGGGSTTLVKEDENGNPAILNRPINSFLPFKERIVGSHLGFFAKPLDKP